MAAKKITGKFDSIEAVLRDIACGKMVVVVDDADRENEGDLIMAAEKTTAKAVNFMAKFGRGLICVPTAPERLQQLGIERMVLNNREGHRTDFQISVDAAQGITTGISAADRDRTIILANANRTAQILRGEGEGIKTSILIEAFGQDEEFFGFYRSMEAYGVALGENTTMVLSPKGEFFRYFGDMSIATGAGVGGGSLIYANVSIEAGPEAFAQGWPEAIDYTTLKPHYDTTGVMLNVQELPANQWTARTHLMKEGAEAVGAGERFRIVPQAITFDPDWSPEHDDPYDYGHSQSWVNPQGKTQGTCVHCGNCDLGCPVQAKNTLDMNYLAAAENAGADVRPLHHVRTIRPLTNFHGLRYCGSVSAFQATTIYWVCGAIMF